MYAPLLYEGETEDDTEAQDDDFGDLLSTKDAYTIPDDKNNI
jgi:hypothetical protein